MSSPVALPFRSIIQIEDSGTAVYLQISRQLINAIQRGALVGGARLPGSRSLARLLGVHRKTIIAAIGELEAQGWVTVLPNRGTFITSKPPIHAVAPLVCDLEFLAAYPARTGYRFHNSMLLDRPVSAGKPALEFTDGEPDVRLAPLDKLARAYSRVMIRKTSRKLLAYSHREGNFYYREQLATYLNNTRGLHIAPENVLTTRGVQMGIYLASTILLEPGDLVVVGQLSYYVANMIFQQAGAEVHQIPVDASGISVAALRLLCEQRKVRMLYLTPHHHYPTTVTLSAERRVELLQLASQYGFIILEDDHDYDFHFQSSPLLPLASADRHGMVVYIGSFCKALAPGLRQGYLIAPTDLIGEAAKLRYIIDRQGDLVMEQALGELLADGEIQRHLKKSIKTYRSRRDWFTQELHRTLGDYLQFTQPPGGLAFWAEWTRPVSLLRTSHACAKYGLHIPQTLLFQTGDLTAMRLGFGHFNETEMTGALETLAEAVIGL